MPNAVPRGRCIRRRKHGMEAPNRPRPYRYSRTTAAARATPQTTSGPRGRATPRRQATPTRTTGARARRTHRAASASVRVGAATASLPIAVLSVPAHRPLQGGVHRARLVAEVAGGLVGAHEHELARHAG